MCLTVTDADALTHAHTLMPGEKSETSFIQTDCYVHLPSNAMSASPLKCAYACTPSSCSLCSPSPDAWLLMQGLNTPGQRLVHPVNTCTH